MIPSREDDRVYLKNGSIEEFDTACSFLAVGDDEASHAILPDIRRWQA
jgi:hypothetical protein